MNRENAATLTRYMYLSLLNREPDKTALDYCVNHLLNAGEAAELERQILASQEYQMKGAKHPLATHEEIYTPDLAPYFSHRGLFRPLSLTVETVNICNNNCIFCPYSLQTRKKQTMALAMFEKVLRDYEEIGGGQVGLTPMVGELFLDKLLLPRLELLSRSSMVENVSAITNASTLRRFDDGYISSVLDHLVALNISLYGLDETEYLEITRKDAYDDMYFGAVRLMRVGGPRKIILQVRQLKMRDADFIDNWISNFAECAEVDKSLIRFSHGMTNYANWSIFDTKKPLPHDAAWLTRNPGEGQCALPLVSMQVYSNGNVSMCACADFNGDGELHVGNINNQSLKEILQSERVRRLWNWNKYGTPEFCKSCSFYRPISVLSKSPEAFYDPLGVFNGFR